MKPEILAVILLLATLAPIGVLIAWKLLSTRIRFKPLPGTLSVRYVAPADVAGERVSEAYLHARELLERESSWGPAFVGAALARVEIIVIDAVSWVDGFGRTIAGKAEGYQIMVNRPMETMLHELAHVVEWHFEQSTDDRHTHWDERGIWRANDLFLGWLKLNIKA